MHVTLQHMRSIPVDRSRAGYCARGVRLFFERHQLDWDEAKKNGVDENLLLATGDAQAIEMVAWARQCEANHERQ